MSNEYDKNDLRSLLPKQILEIEKEIQELKNRIQTLEELYFKETTEWAFTDSDNREII